MRPPPFARDSTQTTAQALSLPDTLPFPSAPGLATTQSRERHKFGIIRQAIRADIVLLEALLHVDPPGLIEVDPVRAHDLLHLAFSKLIQALPRVTLHHVAREIECRGSEARFNVGLK